jgi:hypothetical protein
MCDALFTNNDVSDIIANLEQNAKVRINYFPSVFYYGDHYAKELKKVSFQFQFQFKFIHVQIYPNRLENPPDIEQVNTVNGYTHISESTAAT